MRTRLVVATAAVLLGTGCGGSDGGNDKTSSGADGKMPACSDVWTKGATLPADYDGCTEGGTVVAMVGYDCKDGSTFTGYDDKLYATLGGEIKDATGRSYAHDYNACTAD